MYLLLKQLPHLDELAKQAPDELGHPSLIKVKLISFLSPHICFTFLGKFVSLEPIKPEMGSFSPIH